MSVSSASDRKISEGLEHLRLAEKCLKTSLFKWKPDLDGAATEYTKAGVAFKNAKAYAQASTSYLKAADVQKEMGAHFHAAKSMEAAALVFREMDELEKSADLAEQACNLYLEHGVPDTAALALAKVARMVEQSLPERAIQLYTRACDVGEGEDNVRTCAENIGKAARLLIRLKKYDEAVEALKREVDYYGQVENHGMLNKLMMVLVLLHLQRGDYVAGDQAFQAALKYYPGFVDSEEAAPIQKLLDAYEEGDQDKADEVLRSPLFKHMENDFTKLARDFLVPGGKKRSPTDEYAPPEYGEEVEDEYSGGLL